MLSIRKMALWSVEVQDQPGGTVGIFRQLAEAGADFEFVFGRRQPDKPGTGILFVSPIRGKKQETAARAVGLAPSEMAFGVRVEGANRPGIGHAATQALAQAGLNLRALAAHVIGRRFAILFAFDKEEDAGTAVKALRKVKG